MIFFPQRASGALYHRVQTSEYYISAVPLRMICTKNNITYVFWKHTHKIDVEFIEFQKVVWFVFTRKGFIDVELQQCPFFEWKMQKKSIPSISSRVPCKGHLSGCAMRTQSWDKSETPSGNSEVWPTFGRVAGTHWMAVNGIIYMSCMMVILVG